MVKFLIKWLILILTVAFGTIYFLLKYPKVAQKILKTENFAALSNPKSDNNTTLHVNPSSDFIDKQKAELQAENIKLKEELLNVKSVPDNRKDIILMLLSLREIEKNIGKKASFSDDLAQVFHVISKMPTINKKITFYQEKFYANLYQFPSNDSIMEEITPLNVAVYRLAYQEETKDYNFFAKLLWKLKYKIINKQVISENVMAEMLRNLEYEKILDVLNKQNNKVKTTPEFVKIYSNVELLHNLQLVVDQIYISVGLLDNN